MRFPLYGSATGSESTHVEISAPRCVLRLQFTGDESHIETPSELIWINNQGDDPGNME
jgi:hypothetical protein